MMKIGLSILMSVLMAMAVPSAVPIAVGTTDAGKGAQPVVLDCGEFSYTLDNVSADDVDVVEKENSSDAVTYEIRNKANPAVVDTINVSLPGKEVSLKSSEGNDIRSTVFTRTRTIEDRKTNKVVAELQYQVCVDFYESGSFRAFYGASSPMVIVKNSIAPMEMKNTVETVKSTTGKYPCTSLTYAYSTNLWTTAPVSSKVGKLLSGAGFSATEDLWPHYVGTAFDTGTIDLYYLPDK